MGEGWGGQQSFDGVIDEVRFSYDIIFKTSGGTQLDHEVEYWSATTGKLIAWVRIPTLDYNDDTVIYMYYGNSAITSSQEDAAGVWDSNYVAVWHLKESGDGTADEYTDSTSYGNHGQGGGGTSGYVPGQWAGTEIINGAQDFDGTDDYIACVYDGSNAIIYRNGTSVHSPGLTGSLGSSTQNVEIGQTDDDNFMGPLDEVRISKIARSQCWLQTEYNNQSSPSTFYSIGSEVPTLSSRVKQ